MPSTFKHAKMVNACLSESLTQENADAPKK